MFFFGKSDIYTSQHITSLWAVREMILLSTLPVFPENNIIIYILIKDVF